MRLEHLRLAQGSRLKGQLLSGDLVVGIALACLSIGLLVQLAEFSQRSWASAAVLSSQDADLLAQAIVDGFPLANLTAGRFCFEYSNGTGNCTGFSCLGDALVAQRVAACRGYPGYCRLEVTACR